MKKIAVLTSGNFNNRKGMFNATHNRIKHLTSISNYQFDIIILCIYDPWYVRLLRHTSKQDKLQTFYLEGVKYNVKWRRFSLIDYILEIKFKTKPIFKRLYEKKMVDTFSEYSFIISHSDCGRVAMDVKNKFNIPYTVTWHGSDIHTKPFLNSYIRRQTKQIIECANCNYFVSKALMECSNKITEVGRKEVLYNGADMAFVKYDDNRRLLLRKKLNVKDKSVVTFCGGFVDVKNILIIPEIFRKIYEKDKDVVFWMIGDGKYYHEIEKLIKGLPVILWGNQSPTDIPDFFNSTNVLILPSKNEGLPLVTVEALKCGCQVVGSLVGGIPEVIGSDNCVSLESKSFIEDFATKVLNLLHEDDNTVQILDSCFDWRNTANRELKFILKTLDNN